MKFALRSLFAFSKKNNSKVKNPIAPQLLEELKAQKIIHKPNKRLPAADARNIMITSALPYVNNTPHLGNIIGAVLSADVYARFCRLMGYNVQFICGTDQYGTATEVKALKQGVSPRQICDRYHAIHKSIYEWFNISFDHFGRTSCQAHTKITQDIFRDLVKNNSLVQKTSTQLHCKHCDLFLADRFVSGNCKKCGGKTRGDQCQQCSIIFNNLIQQLADLSCSVCGNPPTPTQTTHFYLKLGDQHGNLQNWLIDNNGMQGWTNNAKGVTKGWLKSKAEQRCITRDLKWGIPVPYPGYERKVFYVWFEAPIGYISITADHLQQGYKQWWIPSQNKVQLRQFMGKDNILFHSIIFPASLKSTNQQWLLPNVLSATEYLKYEGGKFSKSHNIGVFGDQCKDTGIDPDCWRYYLLRIRPETFDSQFSWVDFAQKCNKELLGSLGNLFQRVLKYSYKLYGSKILPLKFEDLGEDQIKLIQQFSSKYQHYIEAMEKTSLLQGSVILTEFSDLVNQYVGKTQFWKNPKKQMILALLVRMLRVISIIFEPFIPSICARMSYLLGVSNQSPPSAFILMRSFNKFLMSSLDNSTGLKDPIPLINESKKSLINYITSQYVQDQIRQPLPVIEKLIKLYIIMKHHVGRRARITRTFLPSPIQQSFNRTDGQGLTLFKRVQNNHSILQKYQRDRDSKTTQNFQTRGRFILSKRLQQLAKIKTARLSIQPSSRTIEIKQKDMRSTRRTISVGRDEVYDLEIANINKTISGTKLGALSALQIMEQLEENQQAQKRNQSFRGYDRIIKRIDSEIGEQSYNLGTSKKLSFNQQKSHYQPPKSLQKMFETIYNGSDGFIDKFKEYQMSLLQRIPSYKSRHLTLDYKNQWRI